MCTLVVTIYNIFLTFQLKMNPTSVKVLGFAVKKSSRTVFISPIPPKNFPLKRVFMHETDDKTVGGKKVGG